MVTKPLADGRMEAQRALHLLVFPCMARYGLGMTVGLMVKATATLFPRSLILLLQLFTSSLVVVQHR